MLFHVPLLIHVALAANAFKFRSKLFANCTNIEADVCMCARDKLVRYAKYKWIFLWLSNSQQIAFEKYTYKTYELVQVFIYSSNTPVVVSLPQQQHLCHFCYYLHHLLFYRPRNHFNQLSHNSTHSHEEQKKKRISPRKAINNTSRRKTYITLW